MSKAIYTYAFIKGIYDSADGVYGGSQDYIGVFCPFIIEVLPSDASLISQIEIQNRVKDDFGLKIPLHTLKSILTRAKRNDYVEQEHKQCKLTKKGLDYKNSLEIEKDVGSRLGGLIENAKVYIEENYQEFLTDNEVESTLFKVIKRNVDVFAKYFHTDDNEFPLPKLSETEQLLVKYITYASEKVPEDRKTLKDIVFGSLISLVLKFDNIAEVNRKFRHCTVYLDSNFLFSVLGLHNPEFNKPARELFDLLKKCDFEIKIFSFTRNQICRVMRGYIDREDLYLSNVNVNSIYSGMKRKGWKKSDVREFIAEIEEKLENKGVQVEEVGGLEGFEAKNEWDEKIQRYKPNQPEKSKNHDLAAINEIFERREKKPRKIEDASSLFLTSDKGLARFNIKEMGHEELGTISEVILDRVLTSILWLKNPKEEISLRTLISIYSQDTFIPRTVWERFIENLVTLKNNKDIDEKDISALFVQDFIEKELSSFSDQESDKVTTEFVKKKVEDAKEFESQLKERVREKETKNLELFTELYRLFAKERNFLSNKENSSKGVGKQKLKEKLQEKADRFSNKRAHLFTILSFLVIFGFLSWLGYNKLPRFLADEQNYRILKIILIILFGGLGGAVSVITGLYSLCRNQLKTKIHDHVYENLVQEFEVDD